jgi:hypothetical protein
MILMLHVIAPQDSQGTLARQGWGVGHEDIPSNTPLPAVSDAPSAGCPLLHHLPVCLDMAGRAGSCS